MSARPREMACRVCLVPLNTFDSAYIHPLGIDTGDRHEPDPVPVSSLDTVRRTCDFCSDRYPLWSLTGGGVAAVIASTTTPGGLVQDFGERWAACAACYQHVRQERPDRLVERALRRLPGLDPQARSHLAALQRSFLTGLQPGRTLITTTAWPATTSTAHDLPKIRDRLIQLLRGPIDLPPHLAADRPDLAERLEQARLYWVDPTFSQLVATAADSLPPTVIHPDLVPGDTGLLAWAAPQGRTEALTWAVHDTAVQLVRYRSIGTGLDQQLLQAVREDIGWLAPTATHRLPLGQEWNPAQQAGTDAVLATWLLMAQRAAETPAADIDNRTRKRYARDRRRLPDVRLVRLRGAAQPRQPRGLGVTERAAAAERVWVTGHWRDQPYGPGRTLRRPVYIHPFLRGPEEAPVKLSTTVRVLGPSRRDRAK